MDLGEDALHLLQVGLTTPIEAHRAMLAVEQRYVEILLQHPDAVGDGGRGDAELLRGAGEALLAGGGLEEAQVFERGKEQNAKNLQRRARKIRIREKPLPTGCGRSSFRVPGRAAVGTVGFGNRAVPPGAIGPGRWTVAAAHLRTRIRRGATTALISLRYQDGGWLRQGEGDDRTVVGRPRGGNQSHGRSCREPANSFPIFLGP